MLIDTHIHLDLYKESAGSLIEEAKGVSVEKLITVGIDFASSKRALSFAEKHEDVFATAGLHPHDAKDFNDEMLVKFRELAAHPKLVALGEMGLDFYRNRSPRDLQSRAFERQLALAKELSLPAIIHDREAHDATVETLIASGFPLDRAVFHCFSGGVDLLERVIAMGCSISLGGPVTFANAKGLIEVVREVPLGRLMLETDGPYLAPHPHRGKTNRPAFVTLIAQKIADIKGVSSEEVAKITSDNAIRFFGLEARGLGGKR
ncbi:MAG: TatD family hydrolase [Actinomycetota bacterium]|nr:TatD family hydrolase [Actinomycetota bacterium]